MAPSLTQRLGLGRLALALWHRPIGSLRDSWRNGGPLVARGTEHARRAMATAAEVLPPLPSAPAGAPVALHLLTGRRFWFQTAFCLHTFARQSGAALVPHLYDDGTLDDAVRTQARRLAPQAVVHGAGELNERLDAHLPTSRYPTLRERWREYPNLRKLIAPHLGSTGWKLVIDSDLLFFRRPDFLLQWCAAPDRPLHAVDCEESYGYSRPLLAGLAGHALPPLVTVGLSGLRSESLDWDEIERWCAALIAREGTNYYLEQALVALLMARAPARAVAPAPDYVTKPDRAEGTHPRAVLHHYVAESKRWYYRHAWREALRRTEGPIDPGAR